MFSAVLKCLCLLPNSSFNPQWRVWPRLEMLRQLCYKPGKWAGGRGFGLESSRLMHEDPLEMRPASRFAWIDAKSPANATIRRSEPMGLLAACLIFASVVSNIGDTRIPRALYCLLLAWHEDWKWPNMSKVVVPQSLFRSWNLGDGIAAYHNNVVFPTNYWTHVVAAVLVVIVSSTSTSTSSTSIQRS